MTLNDYQKAAERTSGNLTLLKQTYPVFFEDIEV